MSSLAPPSPPQQPFLAPAGFEAPIAAREAQRAHEQRRTRRAVLAVWLVTLLVAGGAFFLGRDYLFAMPEPESSASTDEADDEQADEQWAEQPPVIDPVTGQATVEAPEFRFTLPAAPVVEQVDEEALGAEVTGTIWQVEAADGNLLQVVSTNLGSPLTEDVAQGTLDSMVGGMAEGAGGTVVSSEPFTQGDVWGRRAVISFDGGTLFAQLYAKGVWVVAIMGGTPAATPPLGYDDLIASFAFN